MRTVTYRAAALAAAAAVLAACGSQPAAVPTGGSALPSLAAARGIAPGDYTSVAALEARLRGVAICTANGPQSAICSLTTTSPNASEIASIEPFQIKVFGTLSLTRQYLTLLAATNQTRASTGTPSRASLSGPHWVATPQTTTADLMRQVQTYLGGMLLP